MAKRATKTGRVRVPLHPPHTLTESEADVRAREEARRAFARPKEVPPWQEWEPAFRRWLLARYFNELIAAPIFTKQYAWEKVLTGIYRGTWLGDGAERTIITRSAGAGEIFPLAHQEWLASKSEREREDADPKTGEE